MSKELIERMREEARIRHTIRPSTVERWAAELESSFSAQGAVAIRDGECAPVEAMLQACVPGGDTCDPQHVADALRDYLADKSLVPLDPSPRIASGGLNPAEYPDAECEHTGNRCGTDAVKCDTDEVNRWPCPAGTRCKHMAGRIIGWRMEKGVRVFQVLPGTQGVEPFDVVRWPFTDPRIAELEAALKKYGRHSQHCSPYMKEGVRVTCTCGYEKVTEPLEGE